VPDCCLANQGRSDYFYERVWIILYIETSHIH